MNDQSCNCVVCSQEFIPSELNSIALDKINITNFKVCLGCLDSSDPAEDYRQVRDIIYNYLSQTKSLK